MEVDRLDRMILDALVHDSDKSRKLVASKLKISEPSLSKRISLLEQQGVIRAYSVDVDTGLIGLGTHAITLIKMHDQHKDKLDEIAGELRGINSATEVYTLLGEYDLCVRWLATDPGSIAKEMNAVLSKESMAKVTTIIFGEKLKAEKYPVFATATEAP